MTTNNTTKLIDILYYIKDVDLMTIQSTYKTCVNNISLYEDLIKSKFEDFKKHLAVLLLDNSLENIHKFISLQIDETSNNSRAINETKSILITYQESHDNEVGNFTINDYIIPILDVHLKYITKINKLLQTYMPSEKQSEKDAKTQEKEAIERVKEKENSLSKYGDLINSKELENILKCSRQHIVDLEKEGYISRCTPPRKAVKFKKSEILNYLITRKK